MADRVYKSRLAIGTFIVVSCFYIYLCKMRTILDKDYPSSYTESFFLPYTQDFSPGDVPRIKAEIHGRNFNNLPMDTGSTGVLVGAALLPDLDPSEGTPAHHYFTSSKILYNGRLVDLPITFYGTKGSYATATVPVLVVDKSVICPWYDPNVDSFECPYNPDEPEPPPRDTSKIAYMGVGFGRNGFGTGQPNSTANRNPFLNIEAVNGKTLSPGAMRAGYTVSKEGVYLGLTEHNTRNFIFTNLRPGLTHERDPRDWAMVEMCFRINGEGNNRGSALVDTGISHMYLRTEVGVELPNMTIRDPDPNGKAKWVRRMKPGTTIEIGFPSLSGAEVARYSFSVGEGDSIEPSYVVPEVQKSTPYVNTGRNFLLGFSVAFDAIGGRFGFRPAKPSSSL